MDNLKIRRLSVQEINFVSGGRPIPSSADGVSRTWSAETYNNLSHFNNVMGGASFRSGMLGLAPASLGFGAKGMMGMALHYQFCA